LTLSIALSGNAQATLARGGESVTLSHAGKTVLRYDGLRATDARGRTLRSWIQLDGRRLLLRVDADGARYPIHIDPFIQQGEPLTGSGSEDSAFGWSVALSSNGSTALIGGPGFGGAAWVFTRTGSTWSEQPKLTIRDGENGLFGLSVALSSNGNTALIGGAHGAGAAAVFTRENGEWREGQECRCGVGEGECEFGDSVALSADGNTALIGAYYDEGVGASFVYTRSGFGSPYSFQEKLTGGSETGPEDYFGWSVALSEDGNTALIGGTRDNSGEGAAWAFTRSGFGAPYTEQQKFTDGEGTGGGQFGRSVALSSDRDTALIGSRVGVAWVFTRSGETWTQQGEHMACSEASQAHSSLACETFGGSAGTGSVALSSSGNTALIGSDARGAWVFTRENGEWTQQGEALDVEFGGSVALSASGDTALIGDFRDAPPEEARVFEHVPAEPPAVETASASQVESTSATLNATVNPNGAAVSKCKFEYGTTESYGSSVPSSSPPGET
jgi:hypothetical protein